MRRYRLFIFTLVCWLLVIGCACSVIGEWLAFAIEVAIAIYLGLMVVFQFKRARRIPR